MLASGCSLGAGLLHKESNFRWPFDEYGEEKRSQKREGLSILLGYSCDPLLWLSVVKYLIHNRCCFSRDYQPRIVFPPKLLLMVQHVTSIVPILCC